MKRALIALSVAALLVPGIAAAGSWTGWVTDENCGADGAKAAHASCTKKCMNEGAKLVFYNTADEKLYKLDNQKLAEEHVGHEVVINGAVDGDTIKVESIEAKEAKKAE